MDIDRRALEQWQREQPLCILQLDAADRTVLKVAGRTQVYSRYIRLTKHRLGQQN
jgi:hypothetical protein